VRICLSCEAALTAEGWSCDACGFAPRVVRGFPCLAPELAEDNEGYDAECFADVHALGDENYWRVARKRLILWSLGRDFAPSRMGSYLEIGCGLGTLLEAVGGEFPHLALSGTDIYVESLEYARRNLPEAELFQADATRLPFSEELDLLGAFDVIEHIEDDEGTLAAMFRAVRPGGGILLTVPQHPFLWSQRDEALHHKRRYTRAELVEKVRRAGFRVARVTSFITLPFPAMVLTNLRNRKPRPGYHPFRELSLGRRTNALLIRLLALERGLIRAGLSLPFGGSLFLAARKEG
jgi:SAM-dependent methyltransferase